MEISSGLWVPSRQVFPSTTQPKSNHWPQGAFLGPSSDWWTPCRGGISRPTSSRISACLSRLGISSAIWHKCGCTYVFSGVGISLRLFGISSHSVTVGNWYLMRLSRDSITSLSARLHRVCLTSYLWYLASQNFWLLLRSSCFGHQWLHGFWSCQWVCSGHRRQPNIFSRRFGLLSLDCILPYIF